MEGSIADSTVLRMRSQLQRSYHAAPNSAADGFLDELLKLPAAPAIDPGEPASEPVSDPAPPQATAQSGQAPKESDDKPDDQKESTDNAQASPCIVVCYAPAPIALPQAETPAVDSAVASESAVEVTASNVSTTVAADQATQPAIIDQAPAAYGASDLAETVPPAEVERPATDVVQPVQANSPSVAKDATDRILRDARRRKEPGDKSEAPVQRPQSAEATAATAASAATGKSQRSQAQATDAESTVAAEAQPDQTSVAHATSEHSTSARSERNDGDQAQARDKWYESKSGDDGKNQSNSIAERIQAELGDASSATDAAEHDAANGDNLSELYAAAADTNVAQPDVSAHAVADNAQLASDAALAAQAALVQSQLSETVSGAANSAKVDGAGNERGAASVTGVSAAVASAGSAAGGSASGGSAARASRMAGAGASESPDQPREISQQERVRLVQRVARSFSRLGPDGGQVSLKLSPPQLGVLNVSIKIEGQTMTARLQTETSAARDVIMDNLPVLRDRLKEHGIEVEQFQVEVGTQEDFSSSNGQSGNSFGSGAQSQQGDAAPTNNYDYRRMSRGNASRQSLAAATVLEPKLQSWSSSDRTLDVKA